MKLQKPTKLLLQTTFNNRLVEIPPPLFLGFTLFPFDVRGGGSPQEPAAVEVEQSDSIGMYVGFGTVQVRPAFGAS